MMTTDSADAVTGSPNRPRSRKRLLAAALMSILLAGCATNPHPPGWDSPSSGQPASAATSAKASAKSGAKSKKAMGNDPGAVSGDEQARSAQPTGKKRLGEATFYASYFEGRLTASGEPYDSQAMTAAHKTLPFGTRVKVTALDSGESTVVRINDRGPFVDGRIIDLSRKAAEQLGMIQDGAADVQLQILEQ
ncbi:septal ring lytic transglycosylase RlpA family protein [Salinicola lusitanus]|uniref:Endolytic peptidoglycan transglycosylase RlpA n=1 Tax=Salinicola lusitanus TaxID=1949085 RepID=A0ABZ3CP75_9GAMM